MTRLGDAGLREGLTERLGCRVPAIAAPMFLVSGPDLVAACCESGMVAAYPSLNSRSGAEFRAVLEQIGARLAGKPAAAAAVNLVTHRTNARIAEDLAICVDQRVPLVITALGSPTPALKSVHSYGGLVFADVNSVALARKAAEAGADGLVLVCCGAGGHTGAINPFAFVREVRDFFDGPLAVAGGIGDGAAIRAVRELGADMAYIGTRFLAAEESLAVDPFKDMVIASTQSDIICTDAITGAPANKLRPSLVRAGIDPDSLVSGRKFDLSGLEGSVSRWKDLWSAGHAVAAVTAREPAADIVHSLIRDYEKAGHR